MSAIALLLALQLRFALAPKPHQVPHPTINEHETVRLQRRRRAFHAPRL